MHIQFILDASFNFDLLVGGIGIVAAILITLSFVPQIKKARALRSMHDVSAYLLALLIAGFSLWVLYGIYQDDWIIIVANTINASLTTILMILKFKYRKKNESIGLF